MRAAPWTIWAAMATAASRRRPSRTAPSARASIITNTKAGPLPATAVTMSMWASSTSWDFPTDAKSASARAICVARALAAREPGHALADEAETLGMARITALLGQKAAQLFQAHARRDADHQLAGQGRAHGIVVEHGGHLVGLHAHKCHVAGRGHRQIVGSRANAVLGRQVARHLGARVAGEDLRGREIARTKNAAHDGFTHGAAADDTQGLAFRGESHAHYHTKRDQGKVALCMSQEIDSSHAPRPARRFAKPTAWWSRSERKWSPTKIPSWPWARDGSRRGLASERKAGRDVVLVTSGAVGMGMRLLGLRQRPRSLGLRQACAAVGRGTSWRPMPTRSPSRA
jgi:hypothetical protein